MSKVVLDANVLYSNTLRNLFLWLSWNNLIEIFWSEEIWSEVFRNYSKDQNKNEEFKNHIGGSVMVKFENSMKNLKPGYVPVGLRDPDDEHVVALARQENVELILTFNLDDFSEKILAAYQIKAFHPDVYLCELFHKNPNEIKETILNLISESKKTKPTKARYIEALAKANVKDFARQLEESDKLGNLFPEVWP